MLSIHPKKVPGHSYKNITIQLNANQVEYSLSTQYDLGLPTEARVYGIAIREKNVDQDQRSINNNPLAVSQVYRNTFITLKDIDTNTIMYQQPLYPDQSKKVFYFEPRKAAEIDWQRSVIEVLPAAFQAFLADGQDLEIMVLYDYPLIDEEVSNSLYFKSGRNLMPLRYRTFEVILRDGIQRYPLSTQSNIGLGYRDVLVGMDIINAGRKSKSGRTTPQVTNSMFLSLNQNTQVFVEDFPVGFAGITSDDLRVLNPTMDFELSYLPISPVFAGSIDWQRSQLFISNPNDVVDGNAVMLGLIYVTEEALLSD